MDLNDLANRLVNAANQHTECEVSREEFTYLLKAYPSKEALDLETAILDTGKLTVPWGSEVPLRVVDI